MLRALLLLLTLTSTISFNLSPPSRPTTSLSSRRTFLSTSTSFLSTAALTTLFPQIGLAAADDADRVKVEKMKTAKSGAPTPSIGELAAIRFKASSGPTIIDDIYSTPEPFYTRVGSGGLIRGVELILPKMSVGDRWVLTIPSDLAFGEKGRPASAGKPRIGSGAEIVFDVEMVGLPGKEEELIDIIGDV